MPQTQRISKNNTIVLNEGHITKVISHKTAVVLIDYRLSTVIYNTGGWLTTTTICRMNQASNELALPYRVSRAGGKLNGWNYHTGQQFSTNEDSITLPLKG